MQLHMHAEELPLQEREFFVSVDMRNFFWNSI